jgi:hypothetical protein
MFQIAQFGDARLPLAKRIELGKPDSVLALFTLRKPRISPVAGRQRWKKVRFWMAERSGHNQQID